MKITKSLLETLRFAEYCSGIDYIYSENTKYWFCENEERPDKTTEELFEDFKNGKEKINKVMEHKDKFYLINIDYNGFNEGDDIEFEMPSFCSGDYTVTILKDDNGLYIPKEDNYFEGCRDFEVISNTK